MKKLQLLLLASFLFLLFPVTVFAHGGVEKRAGNILVTLFQTPLSPLVGENVNFSFILTDPTVSKRLVHKTARIVVTQTAFGDPSNDRVVYTKNVTADVNGTITFSYMFPKTNYYDIDLEFGKSNNETTTTGFLVQPRKNLEFQEKFLIVLFCLSLFFNIFVFGYWVPLKRKKVSQS